MTRRCALPAVITARRRNGVREEYDCGLRFLVGEARISRERCGMDRTVDWIVRNGVLAIALYFAIVGGLDWLQYAVAAYVWWPLAVNFWSVPAGAHWRARAPVGIPPTAAATFEFAALGAMFLAHWYWTAFAYAAACGFAALFRGRAAS